MSRKMVTTIITTCDRCGTNDPKDFDQSGLDFSGSCNRGLMDEVGYIEGDAVKIDLCSECTYDFIKFMKATVLR